MITQHLQVKALPTLMFYKDGKLVRANQCIEQSVQLSTNQPINRSVTVYKDGQLVRRWWRCPQRGAPAGAAALHDGRGTSWGCSAAQRAGHQQRSAGESKCWLVVWHRGTRLPCVCIVRGSARVRWSATSGINHPQPP